MIRHYFSCMKYTNGDGIGIRLSSWGGEGDGTSFGSLSIFVVEDLNLEKLYFILLTQAPI